MKVSFFAKNLILLMSFFLSLILLLNLKSEIDYTKLIKTKSAEKKELNNLTTQNITDSLPKLYTDGSFIKRTDTKQIIQLKGVTSQAFNYYKYTDDKLIELLITAKKWNVNLIGFYLNPNHTLAKIKSLDKAVNWAENNNIYLFFMPTDNANDVEKPTIQIVKEFREFSKTIAKRYAENNHILYGLWAEPRALAWEDWLPEATKTIAEIRSVNSNSIIIMTGTEYGRKYGNFKKSLYEHKNIIYDFHDYPWKNKQDRIMNADKFAAGDLWNWMLGKYPILVGEFGGFWAEDFGSQEDLNYIQKVIENINQNKLNYTAYTIDPYEDGLSLIDSEGLPTKKGSLIHIDLQKYPPTNFSLQ